MSAPEGPPAQRQAAHARAFQSHIDSVKASLEPVDFPWYAYHTLSAVQFLETLCGQCGLTLAEMAASQPLLDIGCADGHLSFFLESQGYQVTAVDHGPTSANDMKGVRALKQALGSSIDILDVDLDRGFTAPRPSYGFVVLLGILYHLKNPFLVLETLAGIADYCVLSTRIARFAPDGARLHDLPVAYLLGEDEANHDPSNFWIFSESGLRRLIQRAGWDIRASLHSGNTKNSDPASAAGDERFYCLLSRTSLFTNGRLLDGWHAPEGPRDGWRWTADHFAIEFFVGSTAPFHVDLDLFLVEGREITINASSSGSPLAQTKLTQAGRHSWRFPLPTPSAVPAWTTIAFHVTGSGGTGNDQRPLGVILNQIHLKGAAGESL